MKKPRGTQLTFIPVDNPHLVPPYLVEQIKGREFEVEKFYEVMPAMMNSPFVIFGVFANQDDDPKGFLLGSVSPMDEWLHVQMFSIDKEYQGKGAIKEALGILKKVVVNNGLKGIYMATTRPKAFAKLGFTESNQTRMRYIYG